MYISLNYFALLQPVTLADANDNLGPSFVISDETDACNRRMPQGHF